MSDRTPTAARPTHQKSAHWYRTDGTAAYEVNKKDGGARKTTLADAKKLNLLPSVTGILDLLDKPALVTWKQEQAALAVLTSPKKEGEALDAFVYRVLHTEQQQNEEARIAADKGTLLHDGLADYFQGQPVADDVLKWIEAPFQQIWSAGEYVTSELILIGEGYAGKTDLLQDCREFWKLSDYKFTKKLPEKSPWPEHKLQLSAYAKAFQQKLILSGEPLKPIKVSNFYISSLEPGKFVEYDHGDWEPTYTYGFAPLVLHWQWANNHRPKQPDMAALAVAAQVEAEPPVETMASVAQLSERSATQPGSNPGDGGAVAGENPVGGATLHKSGKHVVWSPGIRAS